MWAYTSATLRHAARSPMSWVLLAMGVFLGWFAISAAVLMIDDPALQGEAIVLSTGHLTGALLTLWILGRALDEDRHSGFAAAADATGSGPRGRLLGRWAGACAAGSLLALATGAGIAATAHLHMPSAILLLSTSIQTAGMVGAWAALLGNLWRGGGVMFAALLLFVLGHLPWGTAALLDGAAGRALGAWLPGPRSSGGLETLGYTSAAAAGLLLISLASMRPADA